jgi:hypothetical protein
MIATGGRSWHPTSVTPRRLAGAGMPPSALCRTAAVQEYCPPKEHPSTPNRNRRPEAADDSRLRDRSSGEESECSRGFLEPCVEPR